MPDIQLASIISVNKWSSFENRDYRFNLVLTNGDIVTFMCDTQDSKTLKNLVCTSCVEYIQSNISHTYASFTSLLPFHNAAPATFSTNSLSSTAAPSQSHSLSPISMKTGIDSTVSTIDAYTYQPKLIVTPTREVKPLKGNPIPTAKVKKD